MSAPVILAVDGNSLYHRAWHAYAARGADLRSPHGVPTGAVYGFLALLAGIADKITGRYGRLDAVVIGFDDHTDPVRKAEYPLYKAQRERKDDDLYLQMDALIALLPSFGLPVTIPAGLEADDVIGSVAATATAAGWHTVIATSDRDSFSLISPTTLVMRLKSGLDNAGWYDEQALIDEYGIHPSAYVRFAAVRGDVSDNLPGVNGLGPKRAAALWAAYSSYDEALASPQLDAVVGKAGAHALRNPDSRVAYDRNMSLMTIRTNVPIDLSGALLRTEPATIAAAATAAGFSSLARRLSIALAPSRLHTASPDDVACDASGRPLDTWADGTPLPDAPWFDDGDDHRWDEPYDPTPTPTPAWTGHEQPVAPRPVLPAPARTAPAPVRGGPVTSAAPVAVVVDQMSLF